MMNALIPLRHFDDMLDSFFGSCRTEPANGDTRTARHVPYADILEGEKEFLIRLDVPGVDREKLQIELEDQTLTVTAEREQTQPEGYKARRQEMASKIVFKRAFNLGNEIQHDRINAKLENGILSLTLPKSDKALPRRIEIK